MAISAGLLLFAVIITQALRFFVFFMSMENKLRDRIHGTVQNVDMAKVSNTDFIVVYKMCQ